MDNKNCNSKTPDNERETSTVYRVDENEYPLYEIAINVKPNKNCDMPSDMVGAYVSCYSGAENVESALTKIVKKLKNKNYIFVDILDDDIRELDAYKWNIFVEHAWKEFADYFPTQKELLDMVKSGEVFFGPFIGYSTESD